MPSILSWLIGLAISGYVGLEISKLVEALLLANLDFGHVGEALGQPVGLVIGGIATYFLYVTNLLVVPINKKGVLTFFGAPIYWITFSNGTHWVPPGCGIQVTPGPQERLFWEMPGAIVSAQDRNTVYFGVSDDGAPANGLQCAVIDMALLVGTPRAKQEVQKSWLTEGRLFFSQLTEGVGVNSAKMLFDDFIEFPPRDQQTDAMRNAFERRLQGATFGADNKRLFNDTSVATLVDNLGHFAEELASWGLGKIEAQTPNIRQNPATDAAAASEVTRKAELANLEARTKTAIRLAKKMRTDADVSPDLAALMVARFDGQNVDVIHQTLDVKGLGTVAGDAAGRIISELVEKKGGKRG